MIAILPPERIREAYSQLPQPLRKFLVEGELNSVAERIANEYELHVDTTSTLIQLLSYVLLGFVSPSSLPQTLSEEIGVPQNRIPDFIRKLNELIFIPLQQRVRATGEGRERDVVLPTPLSLAIEQTPNPTKVTAPTLPPMQIEVQAAAPQAEELVTKPAIPSYNLVRPDALVSKPLAPDMSHTTPARSFQTASVPYAPAPQPPAPMATIPAHITKPPLTVTPTVIAPASPKPPSGLDPYRESIQ